ncbi:hypothetical protein DK847_15805 [Aestuariivirga litoralis]|uniref:Glucosamine inositolphosphorylceramide transferase 1 N-terminal domain-containing protein n=2 Tax=Aestuariivirga litoralis TaxID=2650924 RepID=A0A2W2BJN2_9HYPH|nr:hypothetical protein DK847_15805 [Aestuariivirga litoralis]
MQFLLSAARHGIDKRANWAVYDLGLSADDRALLSRRFGWAVLRTPPRDGTSPPALLQDAAAGHSDVLFWFDCGTLFRTGIDPAVQAAAQQGFWGLRRQAPIARTCSAGLLDGLDVPLETRHLRAWSADAVGFDMASPVGRQLVADWASEAGAGAASSTPAHCEALLNGLLARAVFTGSLEPAGEDVDIGSARPSPMLHTRSMVPNWRPLWTDPSERLVAATRKSMHRFRHQARLFNDTRIDGWKGAVFGDHYTVKLRNVCDGTEVPVPGPRGGFLADPFITRRHGRFWLFMEEFTYREDRGFLTVAEIDDGMKLVSQAPVQLGPGYAALDSHASFPCVFDLEGEAHMIPETHKRFAVDLFVCESWPARWRLRRRLLFGLDAVDSMLIQEAGLWYLITSVHGSPNRHLQIHFTDDLFSGRFTPHPVNAKALYGNAANGTGRNAGYIGRQADGSLIRLMQDSPKHYGQGIRPMRITVLSPTEFHEEPVTSIDMLPGIVAGFPSHHVTRAGDVLAFDTRS